VLVLASLCPYRYEVPSNGHDERVLRAQPKTCLNTPVRAGVASPPNTQGLSPGHSRPAPVLQACFKDLSYNRMLWILDLKGAATYPPS